LPARTVSDEAKKRGYGRSAQARGGDGEGISSYVARGGEEKGRELSVEEDRSPPINIIVGKKMEKNGSHKVI